MAVCSWEFAFEGRPIFLLIIASLVTCQAQNLTSNNTRLTSTVSSITLEWTVDSKAQTYQLTWHRNLGIFFFDEFFVGPFNDSGLSFTTPPNLQPGVIYTFFIYKNGNTTDHLIFQKDVATVPLPPDNVTVTNRTSNSVMLSWERGYNSSTLVYYEIQYSENSFSQTVVSNSSNPVYNLTGLLPGHSYSVTLFAVIWDKRSSASKVITAVTLPSAPVKLSAKALNTTALQVMWEAAPSSLQSSFSVSYSIASDITVNTASCTTSPCNFTVTGEPGQLYMIYVYAMQQNFRSSPAQVQRNTAPSSPLNLNGVQGVRSLQLKWQMPAGSLYSSFRLYITYVTEQREMSVNISRINSTTAYSYDASGLIGGVGYLVKVHSVTATEESMGGATELFYTLPEPVSGLFGEALNTTALLLSWQTPQKSVYNDLQLNLSSSVGDERIFNLSKDQSSLNVSGLAPGVEYTVQVVVVALRVHSTPTSGSFRTKPDTPQLVTIETKEDTVMATVNVSGNGMYDSIQAELLETKEMKTVNTKGEVTFSRLVPGMQYTLLAFTKSGNQNSSSLQHIFFTKPRPARSLSVVVVSSRVLNISWEAPDVGGVDNYTVTLTPSHGTETPRVHVVISLTYSFDTAFPGETYNVSVTANKGSETSIAVTEQNTTTPLPLTHIRVSLRSTGFVTVTWDTPSGSVFDGFAYDFPRFNESLVRLPPVPLSKKFESLSAESNYTVIFYVTSHSAAGLVLYSLPTVFTFSTYPESVAALQKVEATADSITVNWTAPTSGNFSSYQLGINPTDSPQSIIQVPLQRTQHTFGGLKPGKNYTVAIRTIIGQTNFGQIVRLQAVTKPLPVMDLKVNTLNSQSLNVQWAVNATSEQNSFTILQEKDGVSRRMNIKASNGQMVYEVPLTQLLAGYTYSVAVIASQTIDTDQEDSEAVVTEGTTNPLPVRNLIVTASSSLITLTWVPGINSRQDIYTIKYRPLLKKPDAVWLEQTAVTNVTQFTAFPGEEYQLSVIAKSKFYSSDPTNASVIVAPLGPMLLLKKEQTTTSSVTVTWNDSVATFTQMWSLRYYNTSSKWTSGMVNITRSDATTYSIVLSGLMPGVTYTVEIVAVVKGVTSTPGQLNATAKPVINTVMNEIKEFTTQSQFAVKYTVTYTDVFDFFKFTLQNETDTSLVQKDKLNSNQTAVFSGLQSGRVYTVEAVTISNQVPSDPILVQIVTVPVEVEVSFESKAETITVKLGNQKDFATGYRVFCTTPSTSSCGSFPVDSTQRSILVRNLQAYTNYSITVVTEARNGDDIKSVEATYIVQTQEAAPSAVNSFKAVENGFRSVMLSWMPPSYLNGHLRQYTVEYSGSHPSGGQDLGNSQALPETSSFLSLDSLKAGYTYVFKIQAVTVARSPSVEVKLELSTDKPLFKAGMTRETGKPVPPAEGSAMTENTISVQLKNVFSDDNGPVVAYTVIVSLDSSQQDSRPVLPSWKDTQDDSSLVVYQAMSNCSDLFHTQSSCAKSSSRHVRAVSDVDFVVFMVGSQSAEECKALKFCNGPLKAGTDYYIKLRAFTAAGFTDTDYSAKVKTADSAKSSAVTVAVVVVILILITVVVAVVVTFFVVRHKRRPKKATKYRPAHSSRPFSEGANLKRFSRPVRLVDFPEHVQRMGADSDFKYAEEYEDLKEVGRDQPCYAAELPANRPKNRFTNILPYDHSRVKLLPTDDEEGSDYINANYMPGYNSKREYIATQGPLPATRDDFWRMVWEQNSCNIVMLTRCMEKGREKSDHYWPTDSEPKYYGDLQVVVLHETHLPDWTITEFRVCLDFPDEYKLTPSECRRVHSATAYCVLGDSCRQIRHFHYKAWPDFGVPKHHTSLIRFVRTVRDKLIKDGGPIVTHCSAGVGRSGTFIVLDHVLQLIKEKEEVDIFNIVYNLRRERVLMVQTEPFRSRLQSAEYMTLQQYKFIHECLACVLEGREDEAIYANIGRINIGFEGKPFLNKTNRLLSPAEDDEGINVEVPT